MKNFIKDGLNASFYDTNYISVHNKVVYTSSNSLLAKKLGDALQQHCIVHQDNPTDKTKNSIYAWAFTAATTELGITGSVIISRPSPLPSRTIHPANLNNQVYQLSKHIVTAINMSWSSNDVNEKIEKLKKISSIKIDNTLIDFQAFQYAVKKFTYEINYNNNGIIDEQQIDKERLELLKISNTDFDIKIIKNFYKHVCQNYPQDALDISFQIPNNLEGNRLCMELFNYDCKKFHTEAEKIMNNAKESQCMKKSREFKERKDEIVSNLDTNEVNYSTVAKVFK